MKKIIRSALSIFLAMLMLLSLAACGGEDTENSGKNEEQNQKFVYTGEFAKLIDDRYRYMNVLSMSDSSIYIQAEEKVGEDIPEGVKPEYENQYAIFESRLIAADYEGNLKPMTEYKQLETAGEDSYTGIDAVFEGYNGEIITVESRSSSNYTGPENLSPSDEDYWMYLERNNEFFIRTLDVNGAELSRAAFELPEDSYIDSRNTRMDKEGNIVFPVNDNIYAFKSDGTQVFCISTGADYIDKLFILNDGELFVNYWGERGAVVCELDVENKQMGEPLEMPQNAYDIYPGGDKYDFCYIYGSSLYGFNKDSEPEKILNWVDVDISFNDLEIFKINSDGSIAGICSAPPENENSDFNREIFKLTAQPYDSVPHRQELSMAVMYTDSQLMDEVVKYNRKNSDYRITVKDYSEYNTEDNYNAGQTKLLTEIMSGEMPDMISMNMLPYTQLAAKGILEDIYPFIDADNEMKREDYFEAVFKAVETDGKLCQVFPSFGIITAAGSSQIVGDTGSWTYAQFNEALAKMPEGCLAFGPYSTKSGILSNCLSMDMNLYADWTTGRCSFDSPEFIDLLKFANQFPAEFDSENYEPDPDENPMSLISSGRQMLNDMYIGDINDVMFNDLQFGGDAAYVGYPSAQGGGSTFSINNGYAITSNCRDKQTAWNFLRQFLCEDYQKNIHFGLPVNKNVFEEQIDKAMTPEYETDSEGNFLLDENGEKIPVSQMSVSFGNGPTYEIFAMTRQQADKLRALIISTEKVSDFDSSLMDIVIEEAVPYFEGQKAPEEVAKLIQSKVNIYINEQR